MIKIFTGTSYEGVEKAVNDFMNSVSVSDVQFSTTPLGTDPRSSKVVYSVMIRYICYCVTKNIN